MPLISGPGRNLVLLIVACTGSLGLTAGAAVAQVSPEHPWHSYHIDQLPVTVRQAVLDKCASRPTAGHYFVTYFHDEIRLHFEHFQCEGRSFCDRSGCLHETYRLVHGRYGLVQSNHRPGND